MKKVTQLGFFDIAARTDKLREMGDPLVGLNTQIDWEDFRLDLNRIHTKARKSVIGNVLHRIKATVEERNRHLRTKEDVQLLSMVANTILFVAMAEMIYVNLLWKYSVEILVMFLTTTLMRGLMMWLFAWLANRSDKMVDINLRWWGVLTFAGIKGGLSVVMLTMIPESFEYLEMFKAVVIGVIMLSTFIYSGVLIAIIGSNKNQFLVEKKEEESSHHY